MLQELGDQSENHGLKMNKSDTKVIMKNCTPINVHTAQTENIESYAYLGQQYSTRNKM